MAETQRVQITLRQDKVQEMERLMEEAGVATKKDYLNNALLLLKWAIQERRRGRVIASVDENDDRYQPLMMPVLDNVRVAEHV